MKKFLVATIIAIVPAVAFAGGLELYSYRDDQGQLVVVDSMERIPQKYRSKAAKNYIPSFKSESSPKFDSRSVEKVKLSNEVTNRERSVNANSSQQVQDDEYESEIDLVDAPEEIEPADPGLDDATNVVDTLARVVNNNRQIYNLVLSTKVFSPAVKNLHTQNVAALAKLKNPQYITWKRKHAKKNQWGSKANTLIDRFKTIQYTVSKWFSETPGNLLYGFPAFIEASDGHLRELTAELDELKKLDEELKQKESNKKAK